MTAFYALCHDDHIELLTDGAHYEPDGTLTRIAGKAAPSAFAPLVVTGRGNGDAVDAFAAAILLASQVGTFDGTIAAVHRMLDRWKDRDGVPPCEILIAGVSETTGPALQLFATSGHLTAVAPWTLYEAPGDFGAGIMLDAEEIVAAGLWDGQSRIRLEAIGLGMFELARRKKGENPVNPDLPPLHGIGGLLDLTVITAGGATTRTLHHWPDVIGQAIDPAGVDRRAKAA